MNKLKEMIKGSNIKKEKITIAVIMAVIVLIAVSLNIFNNKNNFTITPEIARSMTYGTVQKNDKNTESEYVTFDSFFLKDLNGDGKADAIRGTCNEVGKQDTLYFELNVLNDGYLKDGVITIEGDNFYLNTAIVKDQMVKENYIGTNTRRIELNNISNGSQKLFVGSVRSGDYTNSYSKIDAIGNDTTKYSRNGKVILTATHVADDKTETPIRKEVPITVDWYGQTVASIYKTNIQNEVNEYSELYDERNLNLSFKIIPQETANQLILKKNNLKGTIPALNGYMPTEVTITGNNIKYTYDKTTGSFETYKEAIVNDDGVVTSSAYDYQNYYNRCNEYTINVTYPIEAYETEKDQSIQLIIPVETYYEGYNNPNEEFDNPYVSNVAKTSVAVIWKLKPQGYVYNFDVGIGKYVSNPYGRYVISKEKPLKMYNQLSEEEKEDYYEVRWYAYTGTQGNSQGLIMKENKHDEHDKIDNFIKSDASQDSMDGIEENVGIYFAGANNMLRENGWIKVYNDDTGVLIATFDKNTWNNYNSSHPYMYETSVKHIRVETSITHANSTLTVYNVKELNDSSIVNKYYLEEFNNLNYITTNLTGYYGTMGSVTKKATAHYEAPYSIARVTVEPNIISTQEEQEHELIKITTQCTNFNEQKWKDGSFLLKLPQDLLDVQINSITCSDNTVRVENYDVYEEEGNFYIRIFTKNEVESAYTITIDCNMTPDPRIPTTSEPVELYAKNEQAASYYTPEDDSYDVDTNANTKEKIHNDSTSIALVSPDSLLTNQTGKEYDSKGSIVVAPQVAIVDKDERDAKIEINLRNNYSNEISDVFVQGVIPFENNKFVLGNKDLGSTFSTTMKNTGITVPQDLAEYVTVYYSENEHPSNDLNLEANGWKTAENVTDWSKIKTYAISLGDYRLTRGESKTFSYEINLPEGTDYNKVTYSEHAVYFTLMTENGKYETSTATSKLGFMIAKKYDLNLNKYQAGTPKVLQGVTFTVTEEGKENRSIRVTDSNGNITLKGLYAERKYKIKEIKTTEDYVLNSEEIELYTYVDENDISKLNVKFKNADGSYTNLEDKYSWVKASSATKEEGQDYKVNVDLENEVKAKFKLTKKSGEDLLKGIKFKITGKDKGEIVLTTNVNGQISTSGLRVNETYTIEEVRADGYYLLENPITFKITPNGAGFNIEENGNGLDVSSSNITLNDYIPTINLVVGDEKIPTYSLKVTKYSQHKEGQEDRKLEGAQFKLTGDGLPENGTILTTNANGEVTLDGLYEYVDNSGTAKGNIVAEYTLKEIYAPAGYALDNIEIRFKAQRNASNELEVQVLSGENCIRKVEENTDLKVTNANTENAVVEIGVEDPPIFVLTKKNENGEPLEGIQFEIYSIDEEGNIIPAKDIRGNSIGEKKNGKNICTTNLYGEISLELAEGLYRAVEIWAPEEYDLPKNKEERTHYFGIGKSRPELQSEPKVQWVNTVAGEEWNTINSSFATEDGGVIVVGSFYNKADLNKDGKVDITSVGYHDGLVIKYDQAGNIEWSKNIGGIGDDEFTKVIQTKDGGYAIVGYISSDSINIDSNVRISGVQDGILIKLDSTGNYLWSRTIGGIATDTIYSVTEDTSKNLIVTGSYKSQTLNFGGTTTTLANSGSMNGFIASYTKGGEFNWANRAYSSSGSNGLNDVNFVDVKTLADGTTVGAVNFIGSVTLDTAISSRGLEDGAIVWINSETGDFTKNIRIGGTKNVKLKGITALADGNFMAYGEFNGTINVTGGTATHYTSKGDNFDTFIIKYTKEGEYQQDYSIAYGSANSDDEVSEVVQTQDEGLLVAGFYYSTGAWDIDGDGTNDISGNADNPSNSYDQTPDSYILKLSEDMKVQNVYRQYGTDYDVATTVAETKNIGIVIGGESSSSTFTLEATENVDLENLGQTDGFVVKYDRIATMPEVPLKTELNITNELKKFKITTDVKEVSGVKGGSITGEDEQPYETVIIYKDSVKEIKLVPDAGYRIYSVTINGETHEFTPEPDGTYTMPLFENMLEDKHIVVQYVKIEEYKITTDVQEVDGIKNGSITGEDEQPYETVIRNENSVKEIKIVPDNGYKIVRITINGQVHEYVEEQDGTYTMPLFENMTEDKHIVVLFRPEEQVLTINKVDKETKQPLKGAEFRITSEKTVVEDAISRLTRGPNYYFPYNAQTGKAVSTNTYGVQETTANSNIALSLTTAGTYKVRINASISSEENGDIGWATVRTNGTNTSDNDTGRFIYISGEVPATDYESEEFEYTGSENCNVTLGYTKNAGVDAGEDEFKINSVTLINVDTNEETDVTSRMAQYNQYYFRPLNGSYMPDNGKTYRMAGIQSTTANSAIPLNSLLTTGKYRVVVNASISSEAENDIGWATVRTNGVNTSDNATGRFIYISGEIAARDYESEEFQYTGTEGCYVTFGYAKNDSIDSGEDAFKINSVKLVNLDTNEETDVTSKISQYNQYCFRLVNGSYIPDNGKLGKSATLNANTYAYSMIPSMCTKKGTYYVEVDARISSEEGKDIGYATISNTNTYSRGNGNNILEFMTISGETENTTYRSEPFEYDGTSQYYLNIVYQKDAIGCSGDDALYINGIRLYYKEPSQTETTDKYGQAKFNITPNDYKIEEIKAPNGYMLDTTPTKFEYNENEENVVTIENAKTAMITVNHYLWTEAEGTTTTKVAESDEYVGHQIGEDYSTQPHTDLDYVIITNKDYYGELTEEEVQTRTNKTLAELGYTEITNENDKNYGKTPLEQFLNDYYIPSNATGKYTDEDKTVDFYYKEKTFTLTVKHLITGAETPVPNKDTQAPIEAQVTENLSLGTTYNTSMSENVDDTIYKMIQVSASDENAVVNNETHQVTGTISGNTIITYYYQAIDAGAITVHHYITGTTNKVPTSTGNVVEDEKITTVTDQGVERTAKVGDTYTTAPASNIHENYVLDETPANSTGTFTESAQEVTYYYKMSIPVTVTATVNKAIIADTDEDQELTYTITYNAQVQSYKGRLATVITAKLPYEIDTSKEYLLDEGTYDEESQTITWKQVYDVDTYANASPRQISLTKTITLTYKDIPVTTGNLVNTVEASAKALEANATSETVTQTAETTYTHLRNLKVTNIWADENDSRGTRPASIKVNLIGTVTNPDSTTQNVNLAELDSSIVTSATLTNSIGSENGANWIYNWDQLPKYDAEGRAITYTVEVDESINYDLYTPEVAGNMGDGYTITIYYTYGGSTESQEDWQYFITNQGTTDVNFKARDNGFTKRSNTFKNWRLEDSTGENYNPGDTVTVNPNANSDKTTYNMHAIWEQN